MESLENFENNLPQFNPIRVQSNISKSKEIFGQIFKTVPLYGVTPYLWL